MPLNALLQSLVQQHNWQGVSCQLDVDEQLLITADVYRLQQVIVNLLDNALAFCRNQSGAIIKLQAQQGTQLLLYVHNNGPAIASEQHSSLFQPFVSKRAGGSGLGLAIVRRIMQAHGAKVQHRSDLGWPVSFVLQFFNQQQDTENE